MKAIAWIGSSLEDVKDFPDEAKQAAGYQLHRLQSGELPTDWKPMATIGSGAQEIRIWDDSGAFRVIYVAKFEEAIYVLHAFQKKTQRTSTVDIQLAKARYKEMVKMKYEH
jgi:phage-related protein